MQGDILKAIVCSGGGWETATLDDLITSDKGRSITRKLLLFSDF